IPLLLPRHDANVHPTPPTPKKNGA
ncbi:hypothetical protein L195_g064755, partial [Trifolium pratense]